LNRHDPLNSINGSISDGGSPASVSDLLDRRARLLGWLANLDQAPHSNPRAVERIRRDYTERLESTMKELAGCFESLRDQKSRLAAALQEAEEAHRLARDELDEAELRHEIGELQPSEWEARRTALVRVVDAAAGTEQAIRRDAADLDEVLADLQDGLDGVPPGLPKLADQPTPSGAAPPVGVVGESVEAGREGASPPAPAPDGDDGSAHEVGASEEEDLAATRPGPGVKCVDCGYTNDFDARYCGVCGVDLL
jgi:hypothetical protein